MTRTFIDSHVHLFHEDFRDDIGATLARARDLGIDRFVVPATDLATSRSALELANSFEGISVAVGVHPHDVGKTGAEDLDKIEELTSAAHVVAVGEIGLDYHYDFAPRAAQREWFAGQLRIASRRNLPVIIHTRESIDDALEIVTAHVADNPDWCAEDGGRRGVFHCFTGSEEQARRLFKLGFYVSFPGILTFKRSPVVELFRSLKLERVLLETDAPYMAPVPHRGKRNEPSFMIKTAERMAELLEVPLGEVAERTTMQTARLFRLET